MAKEVLIIWAGRHQRKSWGELCADYRRRLTGHLDVREVPVRVKRGSDDRRRLEEEGKALWEALPARVWTIALDRRGRMYSSLELGRSLARLREEWPHTIAFILGSDLGLDPALLRRVRQRISLGPLTLPHELARLVLYEQLYRARTLEAGIKYHRQPLG